MSQKLRDYFDRQVDWVVKRLPKKIVKMLDEVPLHVEDYPSRRQMKELGVKHPNDLCGCFVGIPKGQDSHYIAQTANFIAIFRGGILEMATDDTGVIRRDALRDQIRTTILHELAHYVGYDEEGVAEIGYA